MRLGSVMVEAGLLTEAQLEHALAAHAQSGRPLGEVIVALGLASPGAVANALAEQHGAPLKTEYGLSLGLGGRLLRAAAQVSATPPPDAAAAPPAPVAPAAPAAAAADAAPAPVLRLHRPAAAPAGLPAGDGTAAREQERLLDRIGALEARLAGAEALEAQLAEARGRESAARVELEGLRSAAEAGERRAEEAESAARAADARVADLEARLEQAQAAAERRAQEAEAEIGAARSRVTELEALLEQERLAALEAHAAAEKAREDSPAGPEERSHVLFVGEAGGYAIEERDGRCPAGGEEVRRADGRAYRVARTGPSPLGDGRRCAYLEPAL